MTRPGPLAIAALAASLAPAALAHRWPIAGTVTIIWLLGWLAATALAAARLPRREHLLLEPELPGLARQGVPTSLQIGLTNLHFRSLHLELCLVRPEGVRLESDAHSCRLEPGAHHRLQLALTPQRRGELSLGDLRLSLSDGLGWLERIVDVPTEQELAVHHRPLPGRVLAGLLPRVAPARPAPSTERAAFAGLRPLGPGEDARDLCWSASARSGVPMTRTWEKPRAGPVLILLDRGSGMALDCEGCECRFDRAISMVAGIAHALHHGGHALGLASWSQGLDSWIAPKARGLHRVLEALPRLHPAGAPWDPSELPAALKTRLRPGATILVLTEPDGEPDALRAAIAQLGRRHAVRVLLVGDPPLLSSARRPVHQADDAWRYCAALALLQERRRAARLWSSAGARVVDAGGRLDGAHQALPR